MRVIPILLIYWTLIAEINYLISYTYLNVLSSSITLTHTIVVFLSSSLAGLYPKLPTSLFPYIHIFIIVRPYSSSQRFLLNTIFVKSIVLD